VYFLAERDGHERLFEVPLAGGTAAEVGALASGTYSQLQVGQIKFGMQTMNDALYQLYVSREVTADDCVRVSGNQMEFLRMIGKSPTDDSFGAASAGSNGIRATDRPLTGGLRR
jgi:twitching motility protein PilT